MEKRVFDTNVQEVKYKVLKEVIRRAYEGGMDEAYVEIPKMLTEGMKTSDTYCCVYKERAVIAERVRMARGGDKSNPNVVEVVDIACDECPIEGIYVTPACRGCVFHSCMDVCPRGAISIIDKKATVDENLCIHCGKCHDACPYSAIIVRHRPCVMSCKVKAISMDEDRKAKIDNSRCISCGACVYKCPFGAIVDKSLVLDIIDILKQSENNTKYKVYAVIAPAIVGQCRPATIEQVVSSIMALGFHQVVEAALGADICLIHESQEWKEKGILTTSCCPAFVKYIENFYPELTKYVSHSPSPMVVAASIIKKNDPTAKVIFIGPCSAKKKEYKLEKTNGMIDCVMSFEELQAFIDARGIVPTQMPDTPLNNASFYGRIFARSGGVTHGIEYMAGKAGFEGLRPMVMSGIDACKGPLLKLKMGKSTENFFEGMACEGGCVNGALSITHSPKNIVDVDKYGSEAKEKSVEASLMLYNM